MIQSYLRSNGLADRYGNIYRGHCFAVGFYHCSEPLLFLHITRFYQVQTTKVSLLFITSFHHYLEIPLDIA